jgi:hypothetical protein
MLHQRCSSAAGTDCPCPVANAGKNTNSSVMHVATLDISSVMAPVLKGVYLYVGEDKGAWAGHYYATRLTG